MILCGKTAFVYGVPDPLPVIPGFVVDAAPDRFLGAYKDGHRFIVQEFPDHFDLAPLIDHTDCYNFDESIHIPKEKRGEPNPIL